MIKRRYIPGFDWLKLIGATFIVAFHLDLTDALAIDIDPKLSGMFGDIIPIFFMIAGYLMCVSIHTKEQPAQYIKRYIMKYGTIYILLNFFANLVQYINIYFESGIFMYKDFIFVMCVLPFEAYYLYQLWFIPPLLWGIGINGYVFHKKKEIVFGKWLISISLFGIIFLTYGYGYLISCLAKECIVIDLVERIFGILMRILRGVFCVYMGMWIAKYREKMSGKNTFWVIITAVIVSVIEGYMLLQFSDLDGQYFVYNISSYLWSVVVFWGILHLPGMFLKKYHAYINTYTILTFFAHVSEYHVLDKWIDNDWMKFFIIVILNIGVSILFVNRKKRRVGVKDGF